MKASSQKMPRMNAVWLWWSSGKDSAWTLHELRAQPDVDVTGLVTTVNEDLDRVSVHAVRRDLLHAQAQSIGLELRTVLLPHPCPNDAYEAAFRKTIEDARDHGVEYMAFGDLFLDDVRSYREGLLDDTGVEPVFPLWGRDTTRLAREMIDGGLRATITCVDPNLVPGELAGREFDARLMTDLPTGADPCGERGEFHTFAWSGPMFSKPVPCKIGETVERDGFIYADLMLDRELPPRLRAAETKTRDVR